LPPARGVCMQLEGDLNCCRKSNICLVLELLLSCKLLLGSVSLSFLTFLSLALSLLWSVFGSFERSFIGPVEEQVCRWTGD